MRGSARCVYAIAVAGMLVVSGCGGSSGSKTSSGGGSFATSADAICSEDAAAAVAATRTPGLNTKLATQQVDALVSARQSALGKLRALSPPGSDATAYRAFLSAWPAVEGVWRRNVAQIAKGAAAYDGGGAASAALDAAQSAAAKAGLVACAGKLPSADASQITSFIQGGELHPTPAICTQQTSKRFLAVSGGMSACLQSAKTRSTTVRISNLHGTAPIASALIARAGGNQPGGNFVFWMVKLDGRWQLDDAY